jgi:hypothetical protein
MSSDNKSKTPVQLTLTVIGSLAIGIVLGLVISQILLKKNPTKMDNPDIAKSTTDESIFLEQTALINAKVTKISPESVTVKNANGVEATFRLTNQTGISKQPGSGKPSTQATAADIKIGEFLIINLKKVSDNYQIQSIVIPPPLGTPPSPPALPSSN